MTQVGQNGSDDRLVRPPVDGRPVYFTVSTGVETDYRQDFDGPGGPVTRCSSSSTPRWFAGVSAQDELPTSLYRLAFRDAFSLRAT
jgi:hypothetical protein